MRLTCLALTSTASETPHPKPFAAEVAPSEWDQGTVTLVAAGVGEVDIIDPDVVSITNLNRQVVFEEAEVGSRKVTAATERMSARNSDVTIHPHRLRVESIHDLDPFVEGADLVINCADEPSVAVMSDLVAEAAHSKGVTHLVGGGYGGNLGIPGTSVVPGSSVCWRCVRSDTENDHGRAETIAIKGRTREGGSIAPVAGLVGNLVAWEAIKLLLGLPASLSNKVRELNIMTLDWRVRDVPARSDCSRCGNIAESRT